MLHKSALTFALLLLLSFASCSNTTFEPTKKAGTLPFKAAVIYNFGGAQPVAQNKFYLLNKDFDEILDDAGDSSYKIFIEPEHMLAGFNRGTLANPEFQKPGIAEEGIKQYIVSSITTDFEGSGKFENVPLGKYFLVGFTTLRDEKQFVLWTLPVEVTADNQTILLSQINGFSGLWYETKRERQRDKERNP